MELTRKQEEAIKIILDRYRSGEKFSVMSGFAGTGKSTCVKFIVDALLNSGGITEDDICYCSFTGKAVQVLLDKGNKNAITAHKLLYKAFPLPNGKFRYEPKPELEYKVIVCDEVSMLPMPMAKLLLSHEDIYVIFCGDPGQLPPVSSADDNHLLDNPHIMLTEIMRQAADSGIIQLSMKIRNGERIDGFKTTEAIVLPRRELVDGMLGWSDIVLCATNQTRINLNNQIRTMKGHEGVLAEGEKVIALRNYWDTVGSNGTALTNGAIGSVRNIFETEYHYPMFCHVPNNTAPVVCGQFIGDNGEVFESLEMDRKCIYSGETLLTDRQKYQIGRNKKLSHLIPYEFTYGYCITVWKAQGSEFDKVLGIEEGHPFKREDHKKYLYTLVTRASKSCVLVRKE